MSDRPVRNNVDLFVAGVEPDNRSYIESAWTIAGFTLPSVAKFRKTRGIPQT
jgi:hypothetical protein